MSHSITMYQVDAFAGQVFSGNPAAVIELQQWPTDEILGNIAAENNLSETAFLVAAKQTAEQQYDYELRWFTPAAEVDLCGHATLASAHVLFTHLGVQQPAIRFSTRSGVLTVTRTEQGWLEMNFPAAQLQQVSIPELLTRALGETPQEVHLGYDYIAVLDNEAQVSQLTPDMSLLSQLEGRGVLVTAKGEHCDFVSRCFFPKLDVNEDPVTGSAHCELAPLWYSKLQCAAGQRLIGKQLSKRGGQVECEMQGARVLLRGQAVTYMQAELFVPL